MTKDEKQKMMKDFLTRVNPEALELVKILAQAMVEMEQLEPYADDIFKAIDLIWEVVERKPASDRQNHMIVGILLHEMMSSGRQDLISSLIKAMEKHAKDLISSLMAMEKHAKNN